MLTEKKPHNNNIKTFINSLKILFIKVLLNKRYYFYVVVEQFCNTLNIKITMMVKNVIQFFSPMTVRPELCFITI